MMWRKEHYTALDEIPTSVVSAYLAAHGWQQVESYGDKGHFWRFDEDGPEVMVPASRDFSDYALRLWQILDTLSETEERGSLEILRDLSLADFDLVRVGNPESCEDDFLPVDKGLEVIKESRNLLWASAYSTISPQPVFLTRGTAKVVEYLRTVQLSPTGQDGFQVHLLSPLNPFPRQVMETLISGLRATREAAGQTNSDMNSSDFDDWVSSGVSANLCDAVGNLVNEKNGEGLEISVQWAQFEQRPEEFYKFRFTKSDAQALKEVASILKGWRGREVERIEGYVTALARRASRRQGSVIISASIDGTDRNIKVDFGPADYTRIVQAHDNRRIVSVTGNLKRYGRGWILDNPRNLVVNGDE